mmetsp:Transcript_555/g.1590  ORF Transcript_555/g.1590 Transcript_555/m.1590 type:complete len:364 (-) Transcript_555:53-1144(-)
MVWPGPDRSGDPERPSRFRHADLRAPQTQRIGRGSQRGRDPQTGQPADDAIEPLGAKSGKPARGCDHGAGHARLCRRGCGDQGAGGNPLHRSDHRYAGPWRRRGLCPHLPRTGPAALVARLSRARGDHPQSGGVDRRGGLCHRALAHPAFHRLGHPAGRAALGHLGCGTLSGRAGGLATLGRDPCGLWRRPADHPSRHKRLQLAGTLCGAGGRGPRNPRFVHPQRQGRCQFRPTQHAGVFLAGACRNLADAGQRLRHGQPCPTGMGPFGRLRPDWGRCLFCHHRRHAHRRDQLCHALPLLPHDLCADHRRGLFRGNPRRADPHRGGDHHPLRPLYALARTGRKIRTCGVKPLVVSATIALNAA